MRDFLIRLRDLFRPMPLLYGGGKGRAFRERGFVISRAGGSMNLQRGRYVDRGDYEKRRERVLRFNFD